ncbi:type II/IV secretion system protein [Pseudomonas sp. CFBP 8758]|uniref:Type II/IV secretion system protein n=1 Tax=Pseudomonas baltica TaxID=2762576 RepID=A0A7X1G7A4_9PSED|nr:MULTISPECIES: GspE/PulE family protein [Pseudomonas]MBC2679496.1 type II/IV secretion system protein [Pseudomonas baltica]MBD8594221.1 type II/IV secretion system protein [Pseudomonas sp. CFBP 8758]
MTLVATPRRHCPDGSLNLDDLIDALLVEGLIAADVAQALCDDLKQECAHPAHPLQRLADCRLPDPRQPGHLLTLEVLSRWLADHAGQPYLRIDPLCIDVATVVALMPQAFAMRHNILAVAVDEHSVTIASAQPWQRQWEADLAHALKRSIKRVVANPADIQRFTEQFFQLARSVSGARVQGQPGAAGNLEQLLQLGDMATVPAASDQHVINIVDWLFQYAFEQRASDIHIEPRRDFGALRFRIDGLLHCVYRFPEQVTLAIVSRLKSLGRMNVAEKRKPQDGRIKTRLPQGQEIELRLSTLPTAFGEKLVMRIFDPQVLLKDFAQLGLVAEDLRRWQQMTSQAHGIVLVTGPTGSGKTTTLYTTLKQLATPQINLCTIEDPIEMVEPAFNQLQVQHNIDLDFASGLRALMRQDPDIIMIGEIRDLETAEMAIQAALTGHLVVSTLHTNDAVGAITRLLELGVAHYLIKATVLGVMAQRLVRTLCEDCKAPVRIDPKSWQALIEPWRMAVPEGARRAVGCPRCRDTGYCGRAGVYEVLLISDGVKACIDAHTDLAELRRQACREGMRSLRLSGARQIAAGLTTLEEVLRVTPRIESL